VYTHQGKTGQSLVDVGGFLDDNADTLKTVITTGTRLDLDRAIAAWQTYATDQTGNALAAQGATQKQRALREALLRQHMAPIARIAKARLPRTPELTPLRMPRSNPSVQRLATAAYGMAQEAAKHVAVFVAAGQPVDFLTGLTDAADALIASVGARSQSRSRRRAATAGLRDALSAGRHCVGILDALIQRALKDDHALLAGWNAVKRVQLVGTRSATTGTSHSPQVPTPAPTPVPTPAAATTTAA
jgi:hypothetical protein